MLFWKQEKFTYINHVSYYVILQLFSSYRIHFCWSLYTNSKNGVTCFELTDSSITDAKPSVSLWRGTKGIENLRAHKRVKIDPTRLTCPPTEAFSRVGFSKICMAYISLFHFQNSNQCPLAFPLSPALPARSAALTYSRLTQFSGSSHAAARLCGAGGADRLSGRCVAELHHGGLSSKHSQHQMLACLSPLPFLLWRLSYGCECLC